MAVQILVPIFLPTRMMALTGGPSQPETTSFTPVGVSDMVDVFSGDFQYNIPLLDVGGYPVNLSYSGGITMDQQATCVGLGWNLNAGGVITRTMRGIPDDFNGTDKIINTTHMKANTTVGANVTFGDVEVVGKKLSDKVNVNVGFGVFVNNYTGIGFELSADATVSLGDKNKPNMNLGLGLTANSDKGIDVRNKVGISASAKKTETSQNRMFEGSLGLSASYNSRAGLRSIGIDANYKATGDNFHKKSKVKKINTEGGIGTSIPVGTTSYIPQIGQSMLSTSVSIDFGTGLELYWVNGKIRMGGYFNDQRVISPRKEQAAYGYLYADKGVGNSAAMHDFNREKDASFTNNTPALPMTQTTYDIYTASGQGVSGMYRPFRDFGTVYDPEVASFSTGSSLGGDLGATNTMKGGFNLDANFNYSRSGRWTHGSNPNASLLNYQGKRSPTYEPVYFRSAGEFSTIDEEYFEKIQGLDPVRLDITKEGATNSYQRRTDNGEAARPVKSNYRTKRERKNEPVTTLTADDAKQVGLEKNIKYYQMNAQMDPATSSISRTTDGRQGHHISEITVNRTDGTRYIYGNQVYNYKQKEATFNTKKGTGSALTGLVDYLHGTDNTIENKNGIDHYFSSTEMPAYATAYDLTAVVSADYSDIDGVEGPSPGDLGNYTKFTYSKQYSKSTGLYKWRNPYNENKANFSEGYKSKQSDNKGNYLYGEKEIELLHTIETKNYVAEFYYSDRKDAFDVAGEQGGRGSHTLKKLDSINLYTRCDREQHRGAAILLKKINFVYDYSLCKGIPSNNNSQSLDANEQSNEGGKLTLKRVFFTYENSRKGALSPYIFHYADPDHDLDSDAANNPDYDFRANDRWGNYKPANGAMNNSENPYVEQDDSSATNLRAGAWALNTIQLPSGGLIKVDLEADEYAYVQDKRATRMVPVLGFSNTKNGTPQGVLYSKPVFGSGTDNLFVIVPTAPGIDDDTQFKKRYIGEGKDQITNLFYRCFIDLTGRGEKEYISGYAPVVNAGSNGNGTGWIELRPTNLEDKGDAKIHPIAKTAMQFMRLNLPEYMFGDNPEDYGPPQINILYKIAGLIEEVKRMIAGTNRVMRSKGFGKEVDVNKSFVRLQAPGFRKLGGGSRVSKIVINDRWSTMKGQASSGDFEYGQTYNYDKKQDNPKSSIPMGETISSGVAVYEPFLGNEENPLRQPIAYSEERMMAPDNDYYQETPYGEMFYPSPSVGYSRVTVTNLSRNGVHRTATGSVVHTFYTAFDFPVKVRMPYLERKPDKPSWLRRLFHVNLQDNMTTSQSYAIELNNMHGKPQAQFVYAEGHTEPISSVEYFYKTQASGQLSNEIKVIGKDGKIKTAQGGVEIDMVMDERESESASFSAFIPFNLDLSMLPYPPIPIPLPSVWPKMSSEETRLRAVANTKIITRYGILEKTVATDLGSRVSTENKAWDAETGEVLLTKTQNDFEDPIYSFTYPAHWGYDGMGQAYKNLGIEFGSVTVNNGQAVIANASSYFVPGDEVLLQNGPSSEKCWVSAVGSTAATLIKADGTAPGGSTGNRILIVRSGRRNQQSTPIGTITTLIDPMQGSDLAFQQVLNAGSVVFENDWPGFCECDSLFSNTENPYVKGEKGNYRSKRSYLLLTGREQTAENRNTNIRKDGTFTHFDPFWYYKPNIGWQPNPAQWTFTSEVTLFSPFGFELENRDALNRYSSADYKYNNTLPSTVASNARYKEIGFDNFEDYDCTSCPDDHFSFKQYYGKITENQSHSGRRSIHVASTDSVVIEKIVIECQKVTPNL
jgi:hypothetical protein